MLPYQIISENIRIFYQMCQTQCWINYSTGKQVSYIIKIFTFPNEFSWLVDFHVSGK